MKQGVGLLLLMVCGISSLSMVGCVPVGVWVREDLRPIAKAAHDDARDDAKIDACLWLSGGFCLGIGGGCLLGSVGIVAAYFYEPSPSPARLVGKPPEYVDLYVSTYKAERNITALSGAFLGCAAGAVVAGCLVTPWATALGTYVGRIADKSGW